MGIKLNYIAPLLAAGAAAVAITAAPIAAAASAPAPHGACDAGVSGSICDTPGDVGINDSPPPVGFDPYGGEEYAMGGFGFEEANCSAVRRDASNSGRFRFSTTS